MARKYTAIWAAIKAAPVSRGVEVKVHESAVKTLIQAVKKEKTVETAQRKKIGMRFVGNLEILQKPAANASGYIIVTFKKSWDGTQL
jgi:hypothetical protein